VEGVNVTIDYGTAQGAGTGMVLTSSGEVLTNNHVIDGATSVSVTDVGNGRTYAATVVGYSVANDIAVLQPSGASGLQTVTNAGSAQVSVGEEVVGIGNAGPIPPASPARPASR
jgi:S1-C subfamily serine protease